MAYIKNTWFDQQVERPRTYQFNSNPDGSTTLIDDFGQVTELGTPVNADHMNHIENGIANSATVDLDNLSEKGNAKLGVGANKDLSNLTPTGQAKFDALANKDLSNLTTAGQNIANWSSNVTNCITEIPQNIKYEFKDGMLYLKAGSKVYTGTGLFAEVTKDVATDGGHGNLPNILLVYTKEPGLRSALSGGTVSTLPALKGDSRVYYNTSDNKCYVDKGKWIECSFPLFEITSTKTTVASIDNVFNGFGYIGSTIFALPGVKGLIPNGRTPDGSLKNIEVVLDKVTIFDLSKETYIGSAEYAIGADRRITNSGFGYYLSDENFLIDKYDNRIKKLVVCAEGSRVKGRITSFNPKQPFRALDYSDFQNTPHIIDSYVNGASGYNLYSNGFCEQWGRANTHTTVTFLKPYKNSDYNVSLVQTSQHNATLERVVNMTPESFYIGYDVFEGPRPVGVCLWRTCGYV